MRRLARALAAAPARLPLTLAARTSPQNRHPDPHGTTLRLLARALEPLLAYRGGTYGVFIDYCSMPQVPRDDKQEQLFRLALPGMSTLYSHPNTCVTALSLAFSFLALTNPPCLSCVVAGS